jgi:hypothetical protein
MASNSHLALGSRFGFGTNLVPPEVVLAVLEGRDFARAQSFVAGFDRWRSFQDFVCERDGILIGLSTAGQQVHSAPVSIYAFEQWTLHSAMPASLQSLDDFAARIRAFRLNPNLPVKSLTTVEWRREVRETGANGGRFTIPIAPPLYRDWLRSLARLKGLVPTPSVDVYAQILVETWAEIS